DNIGEDSYVKQIAFLTGFDINKEKTRKLDEQRQLLLELEINEDFVEEAEDDILVEGQSNSKPEELLLQTASSSREAKLRFDSKTPSDNELDIAIKNIQSLDEKNDKVQAVTKIAQVQVKLSAEGQERQKMLNQARAFYNKGSYLEAETIYRNVLIMSPTNRDALRGIARIGVTTGRYQAAVATYLDLLNYYPNDPIAIAELSNLRGDSGNFYEVEKALKGTLGKMPAADGRLYFSLGNLYAQNRKFKDAQQAYFDAFSRETNNPDYAYNLAVILDYLNKPQLALRYYREALQLSVDLPVGFNRVEVKARIEDLN
ncbi:MAG: tetratricopeptide repeat protein, partial [Proteobacteria bacterium]|nr:tetratricopeptide repeat protein [Pseudomonadota bacterium]